MFDFTVKYLGKLKYVPLLPLLFDSLLMIWFFIFKRKVIYYIEDIEKEVRGWDGINISLHKFGGMQFNYQTSEIGHIHSNGLLDILFSLKTKKELIDQGRVKEHHVFKKSGWVSFYVRSASDRNAAIDLLRLSYKMKKVNK